MELISTTDMKSIDLAAAFTPGMTYKAFDATYGEVEAIYVKLNDTLTVAGAPMYPITASWNVAGLFLADEDENDGGVVGQEWCIGSWLGGVCATANYGFVQYKGWNLVTLTTDDNVAALDIVVPHSTDGAWTGYARDYLVEDGSDKPYTRCGFAPEADGGVSMVAGKVIWDLHGAGA